MKSHFILHASPSQQLKIVLNENDEKAACFSCSYGEQISLS